MTMTQDQANLEGLLERISRTAGRSERITLGAIVEAVGTKAFGPLLALSGIILISPLSGIPGMPTTMGIIILLIAVQLLCGRTHFWLPQPLLKRSFSTKTIDKTLRRLSKPASYIDRLLRPRLIGLTHGFGLFPIPITCIILALSMPLMELVPFSATSAGLILTAFGLALVAHDGLLALIAFILTGMTYLFIALYLM